jgi:hypothetical protein
MKAIIQLLIVSFCRTLEEDNFTMSYHEATDQVIASRQLDGFWQ